MEQHTFFKWILDWKSWVDAFGRAAIIIGVVSSYILIPTYWRGAGIQVVEPATYDAYVEHIKRK